MSQTFQVTVPVPETHMLVEKEEFQKLIELTLDPVWDMKDLKKKLKMASDDTVKDKLLYHPRHEKTLRKEEIVHYPDENFNRWRFNARKMNRYIDEHFEEIHGKGK
ncbi:DUF771 domain-containing protein [Staphylococcus succinus]|uniref:DUF771 domain-containing protein n=1 Tax=Staphylococcus succinus TaxID=61015 RepID=UPI000E684E7B|nr:DUF771 domain-containing protein [Staphylococcus succinus]RIN37002.1 DUF771 domain-containing protein [Staphylococcus succinus]